MTDFNESSPVDNANKARPQTVQMNRISQLRISQSEVEKCLFFFLVVADTFRPAEYSRSPDRPVFLENSIQYAAFPIHPRSKFRQ